MLRGVAEGCEENAGEVGEAAVGDGAEEGGEADEPDADVAEGFEHLRFFDAGVLGAALSWGLAWLFLGRGEHVNGWVPLVVLHAH